MVKYTVTDQYRIQNDEWQFVLVVEAPVENEQLSKLKKALDSSSQQRALFGQRMNHLFSEKFTKRAKRPEDWEQQLVKCDEAFNATMAALNEASTLYKELQQ